VSQQDKQFDETAWMREQVLRYGPVVGGRALRSLLGFRTPSAFLKARQCGQVDVTLFELPGRQGVFATTEEVCVWLLARRRSGLIRQVSAAQAVGTKE